MDYYKIINSDGVEEIIYIPYNPNNILITENDILKILNSNNVNVKKINNIDIFIRAFTHKSYCKKENYDKHIIRCKK